MIRARFCSYCLHFPRLPPSNVCRLVAFFVPLTQICDPTVTKVFAETRGSLLPDPRYDAIGCIVIVICEDGGKAGDGELTIVLIRDKDAHTSGRYRIVCLDYHTNGM